MPPAAHPAAILPEQDSRIADAMRREESRLRQFIRRRVPDARDVEDILQDVFFELVDANRRLMPIDHLTGWLFQVARHRIVDLFRRKPLEPLPVGAVTDDDEGGASLDDLLPSPDDGPEALYVRGVLLDEIAAALAELPAAQREVFVAHELEGRSFKEQSAASGVSINTLLARKHHAVCQLRTRLRRVRDEFSTR